MRQPVRRDCISTLGLRRLLGGLALAAAILAAPRLVLAQDQAAEAPTFPRVMLSEQHGKWCKVRVGDQLPAFELPNLDGTPVKSPSLYGRAGTVVVFWSSDRWMARAALHDIGQLIAAKKVPAGVQVLGVAVGQSADAVEKATKAANIAAPQLIDQSGEAFAQVGSVALPRVYVLDGAGRIMWFDIEYSEATRRELRQSLAALAPAKQ